jgi:hypothetical protein
MNKNADSVKTIGMDWERMLFCVLHHPLDAETHNTTTSHLENTNKRSYSVGIRWLEGRSLHTTRSIAQVFVGLCSMSCLIGMILVADPTACRLSFCTVLWHVDQ